jgi:hypothetical protein
MANKSVALHGIDDTNPVNTVEIQLSVSDNKWAKSEPNGASNVFKTSKGVWMRASTITTLFANDATTRVGQLKPMDPAGAKKGDKGRGDSFETAVTFGWLVTSVTT